jgi:hypothetical protein
MPEDHHFCYRCQQVLSGECHVGTYLAVQDIVVTITLDGHLNVSGITGGDLGLCHEEGRSDLALKKRVEPLPLLCLGAIFGDDLHIASIRSSTVGSLVTISTVPVCTMASILTSEAILLSPKYSAMRPYSRLLNPAPSLKCALGRNMFHNPSSCALFFMSSMIWGCAEKRSWVVSPSWRRYTWSAGMHSSSTNLSTWWICKQMQN